MLPHARNLEPGVTGTRGTEATGASSRLEGGRVASFTVGLALRHRMPKMHGFPAIRSLSVVARRLPPLAAALCAAVSLPAFAHHGKDFLIVESYDAPHPGDAYALATGQYAREAGDETAEVEPSVLFGIVHGLAGEVHAHFAKDPGASLKYDAVAPALHLQLTDHDADFPIKVGASAEYEIARAPGANRFEGRMVFEQAFDGAKLAVNAIAEHEEGLATRLGYAAAFRHEFGEHVGMGVESQGFFRKPPRANEALLGVYVEPVESFTAKVGVGTGFGPDGPDLTVRGVLIYRF